MIGFTKKTDYALAALAYLARQANADASAVSARQIAEDLNLPLSLLTNIMKELAQSRIVRSTRGAQGGYSLAAGPDHVSLHEIIVAMEGPISLTQCTEGLPIVGQDCCSVCRCGIRKPIQRLHERLMGFFDSVTLADLVDDQIDVALDSVNFIPQDPQQVAAEKSAMATASAGREGD